MIMLGDYIERWRGRRFDWDSATCAHFVAGWVRERSGIRIPVGRWRTQHGAMKYLARQYGGDMRDGLDRYLDRVHPAFAKRGAIAWLDGTEPGTLGIVGAGIVWAFGEDGLTCHKMPVRIAWDVPEARDG